MFNTKKAQPPIRTLIGEGSVLQGEIRFTDGLRIDGEVRGDVIAGDDAPSLVVVSERAKVIGRVHAAHVIVNEAERMAEIVRKIGRITKYETKAYVGGTQIIDLDKSTNG